MAEVEGDMEVDADVENQHIFHSPRRKRPHLNGDLHTNVKQKRTSVALKENTQESGKGCIEVAGRIAGVELENFMCHGRLKVTFDTSKNNCFYIGGPNGSGKSALFASLNIGLGGRGNDNDRGPSVKSYIKEGRSKAKIRLILTNRGLASHPDYGDYVVVERTITPSASTYVLKSITDNGRNHHEEVVSKKKADLDQLRVRYGIQLNNPIFWMSQDRSRHFLQQMKPDRLYKIFMHATELEHIKECYDKCEAIVASIEAMCKSMKGEFEKQKREYQSMVEERRRMRTIQDMRNQQNEIGWMLLWCPLRDVLEEIQLIENKREIFQEELNILQKGIEMSKEKKEDCLTQASVLRSRMEKKSSSLRSMKDKMGSLKSAMSAVKTDIAHDDSKQRNLENTRASFEKRRDRLIEQIAKFEEESQCEKRKEEVVVTKGKMEKITEKESEVLERYRLAQQERDDLQKAHERASTSKDEAVRQARKFYGKIKDVEQEIHRAQITTKNAMMRFGENIPRILELMNTNADKFEYLPKGPIGTYIKVRDRRWAFAVEESTRRLLSSFIFNSKRDHQVFEHIMRSNRISGSLPNAVFARFDTPPHDVRNNEPSSDWDTILRVVDVNDAVVRNVLIDMASIESTILLKADEDARRIMDGMCPDKCVRAYTATGGMAMGRNRLGEGFYRFYACRGPPRTVLLSDQKANVDVDAMKAELTRLQAEQDRLQGEAKAASAETNRTQNELSKALQRFSAIEADLSRLRNQYRSLERRLEQLEMDDDYSVVDNMRASLNEINSQIADLDEDFKRLSESILQKQRELTALSKEYKDVEVDFISGKKELVELEAQDIDIQENIRRISFGVESDLRREARIQESFAKMDENIRKLESKKVEAKKTAERSKELPVPSSMSNPPDMEQLADTAELDEQYKSLMLKIESAEKVIGRSITVEELQSFKDNYETTKKQYFLLKGLNKKLSECVKIRKEKFPIMCHAITMRLKMSFQRLMATRSYHGNLIVDRQREAINISVATHQKDDNSQAAGKSVVQDLKGLSGGERSFTTACFIMALWEIMEAPFRCMDEFDVFMDMINRRVIMDLLVKLATEQYSHNQFIFFTPQGIKELGEREHVQVFEMPKVRE